MSYIDVLKVIYALTILITTLWAPCVLIARAFIFIVTLIRKLFMYCFGLRNQVRVEHGVSVRMRNAIEIDPATFDDDDDLDLESHNYQVFFV
jgi:hypothetical protein